jgi:hypothetical protein
MKSLLLMILVIAAVVAVATLPLAIFGVRFSPLDPITAGVIAAVAGIFGLIPILATVRKDPVGIFQLALIGTVIHLVSAIALAAIAVATHIAAVRMPFMSLLIIGYWASLITLVWQLRRLLLTTTGIHQDGTTA